MIMTRRSQRTGMRSQMTAPALNQTTSLELVEEVEEEEVEEVEVGGLEGSQQPHSG